MHWQAEYGKTLSHYFHVQDERIDHMQDEYCNIYFAQAEYVIADVIFALLSNVNCWYIARIARNVSNMISNETAVTANNKNSSHSSSSSSSSSSRGRGGLCESTSCTYVDMFQFG